VFRSLTAAISIVSLSLTIPLGAATARAEPIRWGTVLADDYDRGVAERKPIVVLFYDITTSRYEADMLSVQIISSAALGKLAGSAIWSFADVSKDLVARNIAKALEITSFPTISVLKPNGTALDETTRIVGLLPIGTTEVGVMKGIAMASENK
jgi:hypothetical protein